jgi:hypothetical protein
VLELGRGWAGLGGVGGGGVGAWVARLIVCAFENDAMLWLFCRSAKDGTCRDCGAGVAKTEHLCLRGVSFVEDLEEYPKLLPAEQKTAKLRVTFFGQEAQTLVGLKPAQVVAAEKDLWWYQVLFP